MGIVDPDPINRAKEVHKTLTLQKPVARVDDGGSQDIVRPGEKYRRYRTVEELPESAKAFFEIAGKLLFLNDVFVLSLTDVARNIGTSIEKMVHGVFTTEIQLEKWMLDERRKELLEQESEEENAAQEMTHVVGMDREVREEEFDEGDVDSPMKE